MGENSAIEWCDHTFNPWHGCSKVSPGCAHCYAETLTKRWGGDHWGVNADRRFFGAKHWAEPLKWNRKAEAEGVRRRVFCGSMCDVFEGRDDQLEPLVRLRTLIEATPWLDWLLLTKRPENALEWANYEWERNDEQVQHPNVWIGTSVEDQRRADERIPTLLKVPAAVRFLSCEPLLGPVSLINAPLLIDDCPNCGGSEVEREIVGCSWCDNTGLSSIDWVIVGGESGPNARPMQTDWARDLRDQCRAVGVSFFFKQWGGRTAKAGGRELDGRTYSELPESQVFPQTVGRLL